MQTIATPATYSTGAHVPASLRVSRCTACDRAYCWKGSAPRPCCPVDGAPLTTTTRILRAPFTLLAGDDLVRAELLPNGLEAAACWEDHEAAVLVVRAAEIVAAIERGHVAMIDGYWRSTPAGAAAGRTIYGVENPNVVERLGELAAKHHAKAAGYRRRAARLAKVEA